MAKSEDKGNGTLDGLRAAFMKAAPAVSDEDAVQVFGVMVRQIAGAFGMSPERLPRMCEEQGGATGLTTTTLLHWWYMNTRLAQTSTGRAILRHVGECMTRFEALLAAEPLGH